MSRRRRHFRRIIVLDFEYEIEDGGLPNVCAWSPISSRIVASKP
jgi:hypothetical protein